MSGTVHNLDFSRARARVGQAVDFFAKRVASDEALFERAVVFHSMQLY